MKDWKRAVAFLLCMIIFFSSIGCSAETSVTEEKSVTEETPVSEEKSVTEETPVSEDTFVSDKVFVEEVENSEKDFEESTDTISQPIENEQEDLEGVHVFLFKSKDNPFGSLMYEGFAEYMANLDESTAYIAPEEATEEAQIKLFQTLLDKKVASITISACGEGESYDEVLQQAEKANIPVISVDSEANPEYSVCHVEQALAQDIGSYLVQAAVLCILKMDYPGDGKMEAALEKELAEYEGEEMILGILSTSEEVPIQSQWVEAMKKELKKDMYQGKVSSDLTIKYGNDDSTESKIQVGAFIREAEVDCIVAPTTVGLAAAADVLTDTKSDIMLTGLGLPSQMQEYMATQETENAFAYACPYMLLWDVVHLGATAAAVVHGTVTGTFVNEAGNTLQMDAFRDYEATIYEAYTNGKGVAVLAGVPIVFYKGNIDEWKAVL